jgi:DNA-binding transcriptional regulator YiaG
MTGDTLKARRTKLGMSQGALARALDVPVNTLARWERGELGIRHPRILALALDALEAQRKGPKKERRRT